MKIDFLVVGKTAQSGFTEGITEYCNRIKRYIPFDMVVIPELKNTKNLSIEQQKEREGELILKSFRDGDFIVLLDGNGAVTLGTLDGANVEIAEAAGRENEIIFGMLTPEVNDLKRFGYHPSGFINNCPEAAEVLAFLERGWGGESFHEIVNNLRTSDPYMVMADFADYRRAQNDLSGLYRDRGVWNRMSLMNIANAGIFSADRAVNDYARDIWHVTCTP